VWVVWVEWNGLSVGLKLVASALAEEGSSIGSRSESDILFSKELYINGVEYILRGLPRAPRPLSPFLAALTSANLPLAEKHRIHTLLKSLHPLPSSCECPTCTTEPYPFIIFLFRQLGLLLKHLAPHMQSLAIRLLDFERRNKLARGVVEMGLRVLERGVDVAVRLGVGDAVVGIGTAVGRGVGESYRVYQGEK